VPWWLFVYLNSGLDLPVQICRPRFLSFPLCDFLFCLCFFFFFFLFSFSSLVFGWGFGWFFCWGGSFPFAVFWGLLGWFLGPVGVLGAGGFFSLFFVWGWFFVGLVSATISLTLSFAPRHSTLSSIQFRVPFFFCEV